LQVKKEIDSSSGLLGLQIKIAQEIAGIAHHQTGVEEVYL